MRIFIEELQLSLVVDKALLTHLQTWLNVFDTILTPVRDKKSQMQLNADYLVETFADYAKFHRFYAAGSALLGGIIVLSGQIFKLNHPDKSQYLDMDYEEIMHTEEFKRYLNTAEYKKILDSHIGIGPTKTEDEARQSIRAAAARITELTFNRSVQKNIDYIFRLSDPLIRGMCVIEFSKARDSHEYLDIRLSDTDRRVLIHFNGTNEEYALLDKWFSSPELRVKRERGQFVFENEARFLQWMNALRSKLDSECNYLTLLSYLEKFPTNKQEIYKKNIQDRITLIANQNSDSVYQTRLKVLDYINGLLNHRKGLSPKQFIEIGSGELERSYNKNEQAYVLNLYN